MTVTGYLCDKILYINLSGEMDECSAQTARAKCDSLIEENASAQKIVINLSGVAFMDSTGIGFLIGRYKKASKLFFFFKQKTAYEVSDRSRHSC